MRECRACRERVCVCVCGYCIKWEEICKLFISTASKMIEFCRRTLICRVTVDVRMLLPDLGFPICSESLNFFCSRKCASKYEYKRDNPISTLALTQHRRVFKSFCACYDRCWISVQNRSHAFIFIDVICKRFTTLIRMRNQGRSPNYVLGVRAML